MQIEVGPDGQPVDKTMRSFVMRMRTRLSDKGARSVWEPTMRDILEAMIRNTRNFPQIGADELIAALLEAGILIRRRGRLTCATSVRKGGAEERMRRFEEYVEAVAGRCGLGEAGTERMKTLVRILANVDGAHMIDTRSGPGILVPGSIAIGAGTVEVTSGSVLVFDPARNPNPIAFKVPREVIQVEWSDFGHLVGRVDVDLRERGFESLEEWKLFGMSAYSWGDQFHAAGSAVEALLQDRTAVETFVGEPLANRKWNALRKSVRPRWKATRIAAMKLTRFLDPVVRRVALRNPYASYEFYSHLVEGDAQAFERRR